MTLLTVLCICSLILCLFLAIQNTCLRKDKNELIDICHTVFQNEQDMIDKIEELENQLTNK